MKRPRCRIDWLWPVLLLLIGGCVSPSPSVTSDHSLSAPQVLVTFPMPVNVVNATAGSKRTYHSGQRWEVPLHTRQQARGFARDYGLVQSGAWPIEVLGVYCVAYRAADGSSTAQLLSRLQGDPRASLVQPNSAFTGMTTTPVATYDDPLVDVQYGRFVDRLAALHAVTGGDEVKIGVIDTTVDLDHPDLSGQVARQLAFVPPSALQDRMHGTAVTGVIGAAADNGEGLVGMAPGADIHVYGACTHEQETTRCTSFNIAQALAEALDHGMDVINMSFAGPDDPLIGALLEKAMEADTVLVAAGNSDVPERRFPAGFPGVLAADGDQQLWFARPERLSTRAGGSYQMFFGSSMTSAGTSGLAALIRSRASVADTRALLNWLFDDCSTTSPPVTACPIRPEQLCD